jgi:hypothetical protein
VALSTHPQTAQLAIFCRAFKNTVTTPSKRGTAQRARKPCHERENESSRCRLEGITVRDGGIQITDDPARFETYADILTRHGLDELTIEGERRRARGPRPA